MNKIIGAFVFKDDGDGCLTAKWLNNDESTPYPEACKLIEGTKGEKKFEGKYISTWIEDSTKVKHSNLSIISPSDGIYDLIWSNATSTIFTGRAMLYGDLLIGSYWD
ncbi:MAG: hypothetical protein C0448_12000 [Sphingobacteriaceae bacterium]|nr:hypothetical protein [Sphingobacteriaceae bacterium]